MIVRKVGSLTDRDYIRVRKRAIGGLIAGKQHRDP